ncbi:MAG: signal peptidase I [Verrucomicrobiales bacterium]|nr:signal peptidase I [Verrucomicrobiales bacterium]
MFGVFKPKYVKEGEMLLKGVQKFLRYKQDIISREKMEEIEGVRDAFANALAERDRGKMEEAAKEIHKVCERAVPVASNPGLRENVEVVFVAFVIAVGIRTYFLQPFKIPTGSMQPTLNGIIAMEQIVPELEGGELPEQPGFVQQAWEFVWYGRNYVGSEAKYGGKVVMAYEKTVAKFFTFTYLQYDNGKTQRLYTPLRQAAENLGLATSLKARRMDKQNGRLILRLPEGGAPVEKGQLLARGYVDTGDQVLVNRVAYHFRRPSRGEVFVFNTKNISGIERSGSYNPQYGAQHYIKRLVGVPGDTLEVKGGEESEEKDLWVNGARATEPGIVRVMGAEGDYRGYQFVNKSYSNWGSGTLEPGRYAAFGDNSFSSFDTRYWGPVPEDNLVGPALFVYFPFGHHWGLIK